jgi:hypothetical protein
MQIWCRNHLLKVFRRNLGIRHRGLIRFPDLSALDTGRYCTNPRPTLEPDIALHNKHPHCQNIESEKKKPKNFEMSALKDPEVVDEKQQPLGVVDLEGVESDGSSDVLIETLVAEGTNDLLEPRGQVTDKLLPADHQHEIKLRTMSWQKAAWLLVGDQVCLAIMAQTWSLSCALLPFSLFLCFKLNTGTDLKQCLRMGPRNHHHGRCRSALLHHFSHHAQIHHEASADQRHL